MADDLTKLAYLNYLKDRTVRGSLPSFQNLKTSGTVFVDAGPVSSSLEVKEYMLAPTLETSTDSGNSFTESGAHFTVGSKSVTFTGGHVPSSIVKGSIISPFDTLNALYTVSAKGASSVTLDKAFAGIEDYTGSILVDPTNVYYLDLDGTFTKDSKVVTFSESVPTIVKVGDFIRPTDVGGNSYYIEIIGTKDVTLSTAWPNDYHKGPVQLMKRVFGKVLYSSYENGLTGSEANFEYSNEKGQWAITQTGAPAGQYKTGPDSTIVPFKDDIQLTFLYTGRRNLDGTPHSQGSDLRYIGFQHKITAKTPQVSSSKPISPCPNPSNLTNPETMDRVSIKYQVNGKGSYHTLYNGLEYPLIVDGELATDYYLLSYTNNPDYDGFRPFSENASNASINVLKYHTTSNEVADTYTGVTQLTEFVERKDGDVEAIPLINLWASSVESVKTRGSAHTHLVPNKDFIIDSANGLLTTTAFVQDELPVSAILKKLAPLYDGLIIKRAAVGIDDAESTDFTDSEQLVEGVDFAINSTNGGFMFFTPIAPGSCAQIQYLSRGTEVTVDLDIPHGTTEVRLDYFPITMGSLFIQGTVHTKRDGKYVDLVRNLVEGTDFRVFYTNGVIQFINTAVTKMSATFLPAAAITCYVAPRSEDTNYDLRVIDLPVLVTSPFVIDSSLRLTDMTLQGLKSADGVDCGLTSATQQSEGVWKVELTGTSPKSGSIATATIKMVAPALPFTPLTRFYNKYPVGMSTIYLESTSFATCGITGGAAMLLTSLNNPALRAYTTVSSVSDMDGLNTVVKIDPPLSVEVFQPVLFSSDAKVAFISLSGTVSPYGAKATKIVVTTTGDWDIKIGCLLNLAQEQIVNVTGISREDNVYTLDINPPIVAAQSDTQALSQTSWSKCPVYLEGDNAVLLANEVYTYASPVVTLSRKPDEDYPDKEIRTSVTIFNGLLTVTDEIYGVTTNEYTAQIFGATGTSQFANLTEFLDSIATRDQLTQGHTGLQKILHYDPIIDTNGIHPNSVANSELGLNANQLPYRIKANPAVYKKTATDSEFKPLAYDQFSFVGNVMGLVSTLVAGDRFKLTYTCIDTKSYKAGDYITTKGLAFSDIAKGTKFSINMDFKAQDQFYIQTMTEDDYLNNVITPYLIQREEMVKGPSPYGQPESVDEESGFYPGIVSSYYTLRDSILMTKLLWKISEYYRYRMTSFAAELEPLIGDKLGNNTFFEPTLDPDTGKLVPVTAKDQNRLTSYYDLMVQATFGDSAFFPGSYKNTTPLADGRFEQTVLQYDRCKLYNLRGKVYYKPKFFWSHLPLDYDTPYYDNTGLAYIYNPYGDYTRELRDGKHRVEVGDRVRISGKASVFTVTHVDDTILWLDAHASGAKVGGYKDESGAYRWIVDPVTTGSFTGSKYYISKPALSKYTVQDDRGCDCASVMALTGGDEDGLFFPSKDATFASLMYSLDFGNTWVQYPSKVLNGADPAALFIPVSYSVSAMANILFDALSDTAQGATFLVYAEDQYYDESREAFLTKTLSTAWPPQPPDIDNLPSHWPVLKVIARKPNVWFKFEDPTDPADTDLSAAYFGFETGVIYTSNTNPYNCVYYTSLEIPDRATEITELYRSYNVPDRTTRYVSNLRDPLTEITDKVLLDDRVVRTAIQRCYQGALEVSKESGGPAANAYTQAQYMLGFYTQYLTETSAAIVASEAFQTHVTTSSYYNARINDFSYEVLTKEDAQQQMDSVGYVTFTSSKGHDARIVHGTRYPLIPYTSGTKVPPTEDVNVYPTFDEGGSHILHSHWADITNNLPYSDTNSYNFYLEGYVQPVASLTCINLLGNPLYKMDSMGIYIKGSDEVVHFVPYTTYETLGSLASALRAVDTRLLLEFDDGMDDYYYGSFQYINEYTPFVFNGVYSDPVPLIRYLRKDIYFWSISCINDLSKEVLPFAIAQQQLDSVGYVTFTSAKSGDARIVYGNGVGEMVTYAPNLVPFGENEAPVSVYPTYATSGTPITGKWDNPTSNLSYSPTNTFKFNLQITGSRVADLSFYGDMYSYYGVKMDGTGMYFKTHTGQEYSVLYADYPELSALKKAVEDLEIEWGVFILPGYESLVYGQFQSVPEYVAPPPSGMYLYANDLDDIRFWTISEKDMNTRIAQNQARAVQLPDYVTMFQTRSELIWTSIGATALNPAVDHPESLGQNRKIWLNNLLTKGLGPVGNILSIKQNLSPSTQGFLSLINLLT